MLPCSVSILGTDNQIHITEIEAVSLFDAVDKAVRQWERLWWYSPGAIIEVRSGEKRWRVNQATVREWRTGRKG